MAAICVYCASSTTIDATHLALATAVGTELARRGHSLVSGGGRISCMGAVARSARAGGARTVGVIPHTLVRLELADDDADELVVTSDMRERKGLMDASSDAFLTLPGGLGTLEELFEVWVARSLRMHDKPVVVLDPTGVFAPLRAQLDLLTDQGFVREAAHDAITWTTSISDAFDAIEAGLATMPVEPPTPEELLESEP